jgi:hypothetical protein
MNAIILHRKSWIVSIWYDIDIYTLDITKYKILKLIKN